MPPRFHAPALEPRDETVALPDEEASHLVRVLRIQPGGEIRVFNGRGFEAAARVELADKRGVVARIVAPVPAAPELPFRLTLAQAVLKGDGMDDVIRDAVMLGVSRVVPLLTARTEASAAQLARGRRIERWQRIAISSAKQCGRAVVPEVLPPAGLDAMTGGSAQEAVVMLVEPGVAASGPPDHAGPLAASGAVTVCVGPEGGWAPQEVSAAANAGAVLVTLGGLTLRADAAAAVALPVLRYVWKHL